LKIAFIGDIVGRPGRTMITTHLQKLKELHNIDFVIANYENASHGFGLSTKNANELFHAGIDVMTGGNHSWDKKDIHALLESHNILRPINYPDMVSGEGCKVFDINGESLAVINAMGHFSMPYVDNVFRTVEAKVDELLAKDIKHIFIDLHAEASSEKRAMFIYLKEKISALIGTHTHVGTDDLQIIDGSAYATDVGMTGCRDNVIGMKENVPIERFITGVSPGRFEVPEKCKAWLQMIIMDLDSHGKCSDMYKIRRFCDGREDTNLKAYIN
jgi:2',3'-cyclic-nucleotide 2'-phosphodiesterase